MRMRRKKWARPELAVCPYFIKDPSRHRGEWAAQFERKAPIHLELGCGKGTFAARLAADHPEINYMAIDIKSDILAVARRNVQQVFAQTGRPVDNLKLMAYEIQLIHTLMAPEDTVDRIYINFCNPWPTPSSWCCTPPFCGTAGRSTSRPTMTSCSGTARNI